MLEQFQRISDNVRAKGWEIRGAYINGPDTVVLCERVQSGGDEPQCPWVTWRANPDTGDVFWGHYERDAAMARGDFLQRIADLRV